MYIIQLDFDFITLFTAAFTAAAEAFDYEAFRGKNP